MRDIWNPWHGCIKKSEGCENCYMYFLDKQRGKDGSNIYKVKNNFDYPLHRNRNGDFKIKSGEHIKVCLTSDFFLKEADHWREDAWNIIAKRQDILFEIVTKRPERILECLPKNWNNGWSNVFLYVTIENQKRTNERVPILLKLPFRYKGLLIAPFIGEISIKKFLKSNDILNVMAGGENYDGSRPLYYNWVEKISRECSSNDINFYFLETGNIFYDKNNCKHIFTNKMEQQKYAYSLGLNFESKNKHLDFEYKISDNFGLLKDYVDETFKEECKYCFNRKNCLGYNNYFSCKKTNI